MKNIVLITLTAFLFLNIAGCAPLIVGSAVGVLGGYAVSKDTIQGDTDISYDRIWDAAVKVLSMRGVIKLEDARRGIITAEMESSRVRIRLTRLTMTATRLRVSARKYLFPNLTLSQDIFVRIMDLAK